MSDSLLDLGANTGAGRWWAMGKCLYWMKNAGFAGSLYVYQIQGAWSCLFMTFFTAVISRQVCPRISRQDWGRFSGKRRGWSWRRKPAPIQSKINQWAGTGSHLIMSVKKLYAWISKKGQIRKKDKREMWQGWKEIKVTGRLIREVGDKIMTSS